MGVPVTVHWAAAVVLVAAQAWGQGFIPDTPNAKALRPPNHIDDGYTFCSLHYRRDRTEASGNGWATDYPLAGQNFMLRVPEVTTVRTVEPEAGEPVQWVVSVDSDELFLCPMVFTSDAGTMYLSDDQAARMQRYLAKGGLLWMDDSWGSAAWAQILRELGKMLPPGWKLETPTYDHVLWGMTASVPEAPQVSHMSFWLPAGRVAERGEDSPKTPLRVAVDPRGQIGVVITHNTDIGDTWEREGNAKYFEAWAALGYGLGVNVLVYAMTH